MVGLSRTPGSTFRILGPLGVDGPGGPVRIPPGRQQVLLAMLLLEADQTVSTDTLVDALWDTDPPETARTQVQICVSRLRKTLAAGGVEAAIETRSPGYRLLTAACWLDAEAFAAGVERARADAGDGRIADAVEHLGAAVELWRGPCLDGMANRALRTRAFRFDEERLAAVEELLELRLRLGRHRGLIGEITHLVHENPLRERLRALLMVALYRSGRQAEALQVYRTGREILTEQLGLEPGRELRSLERAILTGARHLPLAAAPDGATVDVPAQAAAAPVPRTVPRQLPADTADFVGRADVLDAASDVLTGGHRALGIVVLTGRPGVGKSTVAAHLGHRMAATAQFPDGQLYCDLRGTRNEPTAPIDVLGRFLGALGIPGPLIPPDLDGRCDMYRTLLADRRVLIVLDDATGERQVLPLLPGSSTCAVVVTSRTRLTGLPGAYRVDLPVLGAEQCLALLEQVLGADRVAAERVSAEALVATVGGLPLAVRIIAARLAARPHWTLASMVHRLAGERHRLDELAHGEMTVRASLSLTHDGLDTRSRDLFTLLSRFEGSSIPAWLAGAVLDDDRRQPGDLVEPLIDVQLLEVHAVERRGGFRYRFHDMLRLFAREQPDPDPERGPAAMSRVVGGWLELACEAHRRLYGGDYAVLHGDGTRWRPHQGCVDDILADPVTWADGEQENLAAAVGHAVDAGLHEAGWDLAVTSATLYELRGHLDVWDRTHQAALTATRAVGNTRGTAALLASLGTLYVIRGWHRRAYEALGAALDTFTLLDEPRGAGLCRRDLALLSRYAGDDDRAVALYGHALADFARVDDVVGRATVLTQRAHILSRRHDSRGALSDLAEALDLTRGIGYAGGVARARRRMAQVRSHQGDHDDAELMLTEVLGAVRGAGDVIGEGHLLLNLGEVTAAAGRPHVARRWFEQALAVREAILDERGAAVVRLALADVVARIGEQRDARELVEQATGMAR